MTHIWGITPADEAARTDAAHAARIASHPDAQIVFPTLRERTGTAAMKTSAQPSLLRDETSAFRASDTDITTTPVVVPLAFWFGLRNALALVAVVVGLPVIAALRWGDDRTFVAGVLAFLAGAYLLVYAVGGWK